MERKWRERFLIESPVSNIWGGLPFLHTNIVLILFCVTIFWKRKGRANPQIYFLWLGNIKISNFFLRLKNTKYCKSKNSSISLLDSSKTFRVACKPNQKGRKKKNQENHLSELRHKILYHINPIHKEVCFSTKKKTELHRAMVSLYT